MKKNILLEIILKQLKRANVDQLRKIKAFVDEVLR